MKTIKIKFVGFWEGFNPEEFFLTKILRKNYHVEICDNPDYVICSCFGFYEYLDYKQIRIMFSGENYVPDFNFVDYAISVYPINFLDRHFSFPGLVVSSYDFLAELSKKHRDYDSNILNVKPCFANMIASHESENHIRGELFDQLSQYKRVEAGGTYLNNMENGMTVKMRDGSKYELQRKCKFSLCAESIEHDGFITEKIFDAFLADTIPIYCGSSTISTIINKKAYIDTNDFDSLQKVVERIIELDMDDEKYMEVLRQPIFIKDDYVEQKIFDLEKFVCQIFDQPLEKAYRRSALYAPKAYENRTVSMKKIADDFYNGKFGSINWNLMAIEKKVRRRLGAIFNSVRSHK